VFWIRPSFNSHSNHQVPNPNITIRNFFNAVPCVERGRGSSEGAEWERGRERESAVKERGALRGTWRRRTVPARGLPRCCSTRQAALSRPSVLSVSLLPGACASVGTESRGPGAGPAGGTRRPPTTCTSPTRCLADTRLRAPRDTQPPPSTTRHPATAVRAYETPSHRRQGIWHPATAVRAYGRACVPGTQLVRGISDAKVANRDIRIWHFVIGKEWLLNDG
jgi:hypothetical protein